MHKRFDHKEIEPKWQQRWETEGAYTVGVREESKEKEYVLVEFPYPSGNLHIGHWYAFAVPDIYVRFKRMNGTQVLFPMGFDAFGLPAENAAIKRDIDPREWTESNIEYMKNQLRSMGNSFSWEHTLATIDPDYYRWTQWMFTKFFADGLAYRGTGSVNWCPGCNTVIANEQVLPDGTCERCGNTVEKREMPQWMLGITKYADRLVDDLESLPWPEHIKEAQRQWIGLSTGAELPFTLSTGVTIGVFTTRPDTLYGATYLVLAPEHKLIATHIEEIFNRSEVEAYVAAARKKAEQDRLDGSKEKTGVKLEGITATNPATGEEIPVYIADYVLASYGTGAIMAVPAHDERDFAFASKYDIPVRQVVVPCADDAQNPPQPDLPEVVRDTVIVHLRDTETGKYALLDWHGSLEGITTAIMGGIEKGQTPEAAALQEIEEEAAFSGATIVKQGKWVSAARYCASHKGENRKAHTYALLAEVDGLANQGSIPDEEANKHTLIWVDESEVEARLVPEHQKLVWRILHDDSPLTDPGYLMNSEEFDGMDSEEAKVAITKKVGGKMTNTYRLRDWSVGRQRYWGVPIPIVYDPDGKAHPVPEEHLPWTLPGDVDFRPTGEPPLAKSAELKERTERIFGKGWTPEVETMDTFVDSSWYFLRYTDNTCDSAPASREAQEQWMPVDIYFGGAEHTTMHLLYSRFWQKALFDRGLVTHNEPYQKRINRGLILGPDGNKMSKSKGNVIDPDEQLSRVGADAVKMYLGFMGPYQGSNYPWDMGGIAGIRRFLERVNGLADHISESEPETTTRQLHKTIAKVEADITEYKFNTAISTLMIFVNTAEESGLTQSTYGQFLKTLAPFAPHLSEELWHTIGNTESIHRESWPEVDRSLLVDETVTIGVQVNGKHRGEITIAADADEATAMSAVRENEKLQEKVGEGEPKRVIYVPGRILNIIV